MSSWTQPLEDFCTSSNSVAAVQARPGKFRHVAVALATVAWFYSIRARLPTAFSVAEVQRHMDRLLFGLEPVRESLEEKGSNRRNHWRGYRDGRHIPEPSLVAAVEPHFPGSEPRINHCLWQILDPESAALKFHRLWRGGLDGFCQEILRDAEQRGDACAINAGQQLLLLTREPLDSLGACALLTRLALEQGRSAIAFVHAATLTRALVIHWEELRRMGIAEPLAIFLDLFFLAQAVRDDGVRWTIEGVDLSLDASVLSKLAEMALAETEAGSGNASDERQVKGQLMSGAYGLAHLHAFSANLRTADPEKSSAELEQQIRTQRQFKSTALNRLLE